MKNRWLQFLAGRFAGTYLTILLVIIALMSFAFSPTLSISLLLISASLAAGNAKFLLIDSKLAAAPGKVFLLDGVNRHLFAEGSAGVNHPVIWVGGGHGEGLVMEHLHSALTQETRSILFDRAGAGWSNLGSLPLTIPQEVMHLNQLLQQSGESGPFVLAGHSFGGLFCCNYAHHFPGQVAGLILMDPTPPANVTFAGQISFSQLIRRAPWRALALHFGITAAGDPEIDDQSSSFFRCLETSATVINQNSLQPKSVIAEAAVFKAAMDNPNDMVIGEHALGNTPLILLLANPTTEDGREMRREVRQRLSLTDLQEQNFWRMIKEATEAQATLSTNSKTVLARAGTSHMFPYEQPDFVVEHVRALIQQTTH